ncbi:glutaredoxin-like [Amaranthus tricolor]|uniref:glutaredoxin-like n=1 Tax=Amaranthus tricolor TaxID=29722 RepID=UPI00258BF9B3|nr:glutaredoxin-like [Amaranthus tricolor]
MGGILSSFSKRSCSEAETKMALEKAQNLVSSNPVMVFSKTYCGFCDRVKKLLKQLDANFQVMELDKEADGDAIQAALLEWTGQRTVPNVFIGGKHIGGCDAVMEKHNQGQLVPMLIEVKAVNAEQKA